MMKKPSKYLQERRKFRNRPRKILNLEERVQAIQMYDRNPVYQRIASTFKCSWEQIKNVILNRDAILQYYSLCQTVSNDDNPRTVRQKKINFLGKVMYEFIKRAFYHMSCLLNDEVIRDQALVFREILKIDSFYPNKAWITDFKHAYHLDLAKLDNLVITDEPPTSLNSKDIVDYCNNELQQANQIQKTGKHVDSAAAGGKNKTEHGSKAKQQGDTAFLGNEIDDNDVDGRSEISDKDNEAGEIMDFGAASDDEFDGNGDDVDGDGIYDDINDNEDGPTINYGDYECDDDDNSNSKVKRTADVQGLEEKSLCNVKTEDEKNYSTVEIDDKNSKDSQNDNKSRKRASHTTYAHFFTDDSTDYDQLRRTTTKVRLGGEKSQSNKKLQNTSLHVEDYSAALDMLRPLEEFAISEEDFSSINLLSQLNEVYQRAIKRKQHLAQN